MKSLRVSLILAGLMLLSATKVSAQASRITCKDGSKPKAGHFSCWGHGGLVAGVTKASAKTADKPVAKPAPKLDTKPAVKPAKKHHVGTAKKASKKKTHTTLAKGKAKRHPKRTAKHSAK
jgi:hypothetical protein